MMVWVWNPGKDKRFSLLQNFLDWLWGPTSLLFNEY
jgi:hypothetical protein